MKKILFKITIVSLMLGCAPLAAQTNNKSVLQKSDVGILQSSQEVESQSKIFKWKPLTPNEIILIFALLVAIFGEKAWDIHRKNKKKKSLRKLLRIPLIQFKHDLLRIRDERNPWNQEKERPGRTRIIFNDTSFDEIKNYFYLFTEIVIPHFETLDLASDTKIPELFIHYKNNIETIKTRKDAGEGHLQFNSVNNLLERLDAAIKEISSPTIIQLIAGRLKSLKNKEKKNMENNKNLEIDLYKLRERASEDFRSLLAEGNKVWNGILRLIITLSSSFLVLTIAVVDKLFPLGQPPIELSNYLIFGWIFLFVAIIFGIIAEINENIFYVGQAKENADLIKECNKKIAEGKTKELFSVLQGEKYIVNNSIFWGATSIDSFIFAILCICIAMLEKVLSPNKCIFVLVLSIIFLVVVNIYLIRERNKNL